MKNRLLAIVLCFCAAVTAGMNAHAQELRADIFISSLLETVKERLEQAEEMMSAMGVDVKVTAYFDEADRAIVYCTRVFSLDVYTSCDVNAAKTGGLIGMVKVSMEEDPTGEELALLADEFERYNLSFRWEYVYQDQSKSATVTPMEMKLYFSGFGTER